VFVCVQRFSWRCTARSNVLGLRGVARVLRWRSDQPMISSGYHQYEQPSSRLLRCDDDLLVAPSFAFADLQ
jgi:hypothetical protein